MELLVYILYRVFAFILNISPKFIVKYILKIWAKLAYIFDKKHKRIAFINLDFAYGDVLSYEQKEMIVKETYYNLVLNLYEFVKNQTSTFQEIVKKVEIQNDKYILEAINNDEKIILVTAHYGIWELAIPYISLKYKPISVISKPIKNRYLNKLFKKGRAKNNLQMFEKHGAAKKIVKALKDKRVVAMAIDQSISQSEASIVEFFGKKVTQTDSPVRFAAKFQATIIPILFVREDFDKHKAYFTKPIKVPKDASEEDITAYSQEISNVFEKQIKDKPSDWFWQHKRFKEFNKEIYE